MQWVLALSLCLCAVAAIVAYDRADKRHVLERNAIHARWLAEVKVMREANESLTESLVRSEGKQISLRKRPLEPAAPGWFDGKPKLKEGQ